MVVPEDYLERVYAGVLGKLIGVYLGRPFEGWSHERIQRELGEVWYYVHERLGRPLVVTDDDLSGTFTFVRALEDYGPDFTPAEAGRTWLNYVIKERTTLWWGGMGNSTEHTAFLRLLAGVPAPRSGSAELNGRVVAEQIGAQIFVDCWGMVCPGDPERAADLARRAASVSHDGEALHAAAVIAALEAQAFVERDLGRLLDVASSLIPRDSTIHRVIQDVRSWREAEPDWRRARELVEARYGYGLFAGNCHVVPNHALVILALLYGEGDFQRSLMIVNTCGWDTDCNSGNLGCILGIRNGLAGLDAGPDWRGPVRDRLFVVSAAPGEAITDAVRQAYRIANLGRRLAGLQPIVPKGGARYHFELPGAQQGFEAEDSPDARGVAELENVAGHSAHGGRSLAIHLRHLAPGRAARVIAPTFIQPHEKEMPGYSLCSTPTLYPGQTVRARLEADARNTGPVWVRPLVRHYSGGDQLATLLGDPALLPPGEAAEIGWCVPPTDSQPIAQVGLEVTAERPCGGSIYLDYLTWDGEPELLLTLPQGGGMWQRAWLSAADQFGRWWDHPFRVSQGEGTGLVAHGTLEWRDYRVEAKVTVHMARAAGIAARVGGLRRYYALLLCDDGMARLVRCADDWRVLAEAPLAWATHRPYELSLEVRGARLRCWVAGSLLCDVEDEEHLLERGAVGLLCQEGTMSAEWVRVSPARGEP
ncbi:ADP-ribosylation/Crystallin J1 [Thermobaculum terrenum ATCC BAA-798]|uniref:ADP-ribosylation/Crystallin J1 n=1 Tax=Thermobaculum terrenum (strain ATCC BAA-798 / CCMEE 7001 / YNP1) TaxID=525904 RepID=D1CI17_THET1|nr:ADP-ribosylation/Crystallin J1 [Thermobaculum terrenum ATCC BAA-798]